MRSRSRAVLFAALHAALTTGAVFAQTGPGPTEAQVERALEQLRSDPSLAAERKTRTLRWVAENEEASSGGEWLGDFAAWMANSARVLMWIVIAVLLIVIVRAIIRHVRDYERDPRVKAAQLPTHVRDLDIRPESLPDDIGGTALQLWHTGDHRAALSLLYRGLLSRLVHAHAVPIKASSTEGECVQLAKAHLPGSASEYTAGLVRTWQQAIYGAHEPEEAQVQALCTHFDQALGAAEPPQRSA